MAEIKKHQDTLDESCPRDYIDMYLIGMKSNKALTLEDLAVSLGDMFVAGTETSSTTLKWTLMYLCLHPDVQTKCREEIRRELDNERFQMSDLPRLPYTQVFLLSLQSGEYLSFSNKRRPSLRSSAWPVWLPAHYLTRQLRQQKWGSTLSPRTQSSWPTFLSSPMIPPRLRILLLSSQKDG